MTRIRYTTPVRSVGNAYAQRMLADMERNDTSRWVFVYNMSPYTEPLVRKWLSQRLDGFHCDLQAVYTPHFTSPTQVRTHVVLQDTPPLPDYHVLWPGKPTTNTVWTAVEDYTRFEAFSDDDCATGIACTPAPHMGNGEGD